MDPPRRVTNVKNGLTEIKSSVTVNLNKECPVITLGLRFKFFIPMYYFY